MQKAQQFKARVAKHILINEKYQYIDTELIKPNRIDFKAGQYVSVDVGDGERRNYSIASKPEMNHGVEVLVDVTPGGKGSGFLKNLKPGDEVKMIGPLGGFGLDSRLDQGSGKPMEKKLLFVATGSGISPLRSMVLDLLETKNDQREIWLYWGLRFVKELFWEEELRLKCQAFKNFNYELILSKPPESWPLESGHVGEQIKELGLGPDWGVYICGNPKMMEEVKKICKEQGVPEDQVHFEKFY